MADMGVARTVPGLRLLVAALGLLASGLAAAPAAAQDCAGLTRHFSFCDAGTDWAAGEWLQYGDSAAVKLGEMTFDFTEGWLGRGDAPTPQAALEALQAEVLEGEVSNTHLADAPQVPGLVVARIIQTITFAGDPPIRRVSMMADAGGQRVLLMLNAPDGFPLYTLEARSRELLGLLRPDQEG